jgi:hypothetical protein
MTRHNFCVSHRKTPVCFMRIFAQAFVVWIAVGCSEPRDSIARIDDHVAGQAFGQTAQPKACEDWPPVLRNRDGAAVDFSHWESARHIVIHDDKFLDHASAVLTGAARNPDGTQAMPCSTRVLDPSLSTSGVREITFAGSEDVVFMRRLPDSLADQADVLNAESALSMEQSIYELDRDYLRFGLIPATRVVTLPPTQGRRQQAVALIIKGIPGLHHRDLGEEALRTLLEHPCLSLQVWRAALVDLVFGIATHNDYREAVFLKDGRIALIDNQDSELYRYALPDQSVFFQTVMRWMAEGREPPAEILADIDRLLHPTAEQETALRANLFKLATAPSTRGPHMACFFKAKLVALLSKRHPLTGERLGELRTLCWADPTFTNIDELSP